MAYGTVIGGGDDVTTSFLAGSSLATTALLVGSEGIGAWLDMAGATLSTAGVVVGNTALDTGGISLDDSFWTASQTVIVAKSGYGALNLSAGASAFLEGAKRVDLVIGAKAGSDGSLDMNSSSYLYVSGALEVGGKIGGTSYGVGQMNVGGDAVVNVLHGKMSVNAGSVVSLATGYLDAYSYDIAAGALMVGSGGISTDGGSIINNGEILASGFLDIYGKIAGTGALGIGAGSSLAISKSVLGQSAISFLGGDASLFLGAHIAVDAPIEGFGIGDVIAAGGVDAVSFNDTTNVLTLLHDGTAVQHLTLVRNYATALFDVTTQYGEGHVTIAHF